MRKKTKQGLNAERRAQRRLAKFLSSLSSIAVPGSGALAHRDGGNDDPQYVGDIQIRTATHRTVEFIEVKERDPMKTGGTITVPKMDKMRRGRRILMCRHLRGEFVVSVWGTVWNELHAMCGEKPMLVERERSTRGVTLMQIQEFIYEYRMFEPLYGVQWGEGVYMNDKTFAALLEEAHGDGFRYPYADPECGSDVAEEVPEGFQKVGTEGDSDE